MGRCGEPFAANLYGVTPDMITTAKALGSGFPCAALLMAPGVARQLKVDALGTTFGGGPMACAVVEAVIDIIETEGLLANVRRISRLIRESCIVGPVTGSQGAGFLLGLRTERPAKDVQSQLLERDILAGTSADPHVLRLLPPFVLDEDHVDLLRDALQDLAARNSRWVHRSLLTPAGEQHPSNHGRFIDLADFSRERILDLLALAQRLREQPEPNALAGRILGLLFLNPSLRTLASFQVGDEAARRRLVRDLRRAREPGSSKPALVR